MKHPSRMFPVVKECTQSMWSCLKPSLLNWRQNQPAPMSHPRITTIVSSRTPDRMLYRRPLASIWMRRARPCALRRCREGCVRARDAVASEANYCQRFKQLCTVKQYRNCWIGGKSKESHDWWRSPCPAGSLRSAKAVEQFKIKNLLESLYEWRDLGTSLEYDSFRRLSVRSDSPRQ